MGLAAQQLRPLDILLPRYEQDMSSCCLLFAAAAASAAAVVAAAAAAFAPVGTCVE